MRGSPIIHQAINLLPGLDRRRNERFDYVVWWIDDLGRVDFDHKIICSFMFEVKHYIGNAYLHHITEHLKYLKLSTCNLGKCSFFFKTSSVIVLQENQLLAFQKFCLTENLGKAFHQSNYAILQKCIQGKMLFFKSHPKQGVKTAQKIC